MRKLTNQFQRGSVYYWRRKMRGLSTEFFDMQISTLATDRSKASNICRGLNAESDRLMNRLMHCQIKPAEMKVFLLAERDRLARSWDLKQSIFQSDITGSAKNDHIHNWAAEHSWRLFQKLGVNVTLTDDVLHSLGKLRKSELHIALIDFYLELNRSVLENAGTLNRLKARFHEVTGRELNEAKEILELRQLYIQAQVASFDSTSKSAISTFADEVFTDNDEKRKNGNVATLDSTSGEGPQLDTEAIALGQPLSKFKNNEEEHIFDPSISAVIERMIDLKRHDQGGLEESTAKHYRNFGILLTRIIGKSDVRTLKQSDAAFFRTTLMKLPKSFGKSPSHKSRPIEDIVKDSEQLPKDELGLSIPTINRYLDYLGSTLAFAKSEGIKIDEQINPGALRRREQQRDRDRAKTATQSELVELFKHPLWSDRRSVTNKFERKKRKLDGGFYWIPLLCAYGGFRRAEAAGLRLADLKHEDGIYFFDVDFSYERRLKTQASIRQIPLHEDLLKLGFLEFHQSKMTLKATHFFPEAFEKSGLNIGRKISRNLHQICVEIFGEKDGLLTLKSTRHYVQQILDLDPSVPEKVARDILGHDGHDVHTRTYGTASPLSALKAAIDVLPSVIDTSTKY